MAKKTKEIKNGLTDLINGGFNNTVGTSGQLSQTDTFFYNCRTYLISNMRQILSQVYVEHGLIQALVDVPVDDAFRGGVKIKSSQLNEDEINKLQRAIKKEGLLQTHAQAHKWNRLYGGAAVVLVTGQEHDKPLDRSQKALEGLEFRAVDMWELYASQQNIENETTKLELRTTKDFCYGFGAIQLHSSKALTMKGRIAPSFIRPRLRGWGFSVVEALVQSINQFMKAKNLTFEVLDEFKLDIFRIEGFNNAMATVDGVQKIQQRVQLANQQKNYQNALTMDTSDEHTSKQLNFSGISDVQKEIRMQIASDLKMPLTKIFGISAAGFSSGEDDIENYNSMVEGDVRFKAEPLLVESVGLMCMRDFGIIPDDLEIEWAPLRIMSSEQQESVKNSKANRLALFIDKGIISEKEAKEAINSGNLLDTKLEINENSEESALQSV